MKKSSENGVFHFTKRKGQIRMTETIAVLFIFFVLILFGMIFYVKFQTAAAKQRQEEALANKAMDIALQALYLPELQCTNGPYEREDNCFDILKFNGSKQVFLQERDKYYFDLFSYSRVVVEQIHPTNVSWVLYDKPKANFTLKERTYFVIALRNQTRVTDVSPYGFGYLMVEVFA